MQTDYIIEIEYLGTWFRSWGYVTAYRFSHEPGVVHVEFLRFEEE